MTEPIDPSHTKIFLCDTEIEFCLRDMPFYLLPCP